MAQAEIKFGTDGWRAPMPEPFSLDNVARVVQATAQTWKSAGTRGTVVVGFDTRPQSDRFGQCAAEVLAGNGYQVLLSDRAVSTPLISWTLRRRGACGAIVITASHNPAPYNGIKIKSSFGGPVDHAFTQEVERLIQPDGWKSMLLDQAIRQGQVTRENLLQPYLKGVEDLLAPETLKRLKLRVLYDGMHGAGNGFLKAVLSPSTCVVDGMRTEPHPTFGGGSPEPIEKNLAALCQNVSAGKYDIGIATDGDADRVGIVDEKGRFVDPHWVIALLVDHLIRHRRWEGDVAITVSVSGRVEELARRLGRKVYRTPVGFKHLCALMQRERILLGGEESGGIGFPNFVPERDGILCGLLILESMVTDGLPLSRMIERLAAQVGDFRYVRKDLHLSKQTPAEVISQLQDRPPSAVGSRRVVSRDDTDGVKFLFDDGGWLLVRGSGTEPLIRIYSEATDVASAEAAITFVQSIAGIS